MKPAGCKCNACAPLALTATTTATTALMRKIIEKARAGAQP